MIQVAPRVDRVSFAPASQLKESGKQFTQDLPDIQWNPLSVIEE